MLDLKIEAEKIAKKVSSKAMLDRLGTDYVIYNVTEDILLEEGFTYEGKTIIDEYPCYKYYNIDAMFVDDKLILSNREG